MTWLVLLGSTLAEPDAPTAPAATDLGECVVPELYDTFGVRPMSGAFIQIATKWALPLCVDDAILHPVWRAGHTSLSSGNVREGAMHGLPLDGVRLTSTRDVAEQLMALDREYHPPLGYELTTVGDCLTAKVVSRLGPDGWEPVESLLDRPLQMRPTRTFQEGRRALEAALAATGVSIEEHGEDLAGDRSCLMPGTVRPTRAVLADLLACAPVEGVPTFFLRTDGETWVIGISVADPATLHEAPADEGRHSVRVREMARRPNGPSVPGPMTTAVTDTWPVSQALLEVAQGWGLRLCYEDGPLDPRWWPDNSPGWDRGAPPETIRTISLANLPFTNTRGIVEEILKQAEAAKPTQRFALRDTGGCLTASVVERVAPDGTWERLTPPLDATIEVARSTTFLEALDAFERGMTQAGFTFSIENNDIFRKDRACVVPGGRRVAREVLADALACSPHGEPATFSLLAGLGGRMWRLNLRGAEDGVRIPDRRDFDLEENPYQIY